MRNVVRRVGAVLGVSLTLVLGISIPAHAAQHRVRISSAPAEVAVGDVVEVTGSVPAAARSRGVKVALERRIGTTWRTVATSRVGRGGVFAASVRFSTPGTATLRARVTSGPPRTSRVVRVTVTSAASTPDTSVPDQGTPPPPVTEPATQVGGVHGAGVADWQWWNTDADACWDAATLDLEGNGLANDFWMDIDNDCTLDSRSWNLEYGDDRHERGAYDVDENGYFEFMVAETDQNPGWDWYMANFDNDSAWDTGWISMASSGRDSDLYSAILGNSYVGGAASYDGWGGLVNSLAAQTGDAAYGSNPDGDNCPLYDAHPLDTYQC